MAFAAQESDFLRELKRGDFELHVVGELLEDDLFTDAAYYSGRSVCLARARTWRSIVVKLECWSSRSA